MEKIEILKNITFGERVAEEEKDLEGYFVETMIWHKLIRNEVDVVRGVKGAGKSALYKKLLNKKTELEKNNFLIIPAEQLEGAPVFKSVLRNSEISENEFEELWKLYILTLIGTELNEKSLKGEKVEKLIKRLKEEKLLEATDLKSKLVAVKEYVQRWFSKDLAGIELQSTTDATGQIPIYAAKILFKEPNMKEKELGLVSINEMLELADEALEEQGKQVWITFDRLDVAFSDNPSLEMVALRTLFRVYNDLKSNHNIKLKIFIRQDIWQKITECGFREASHITKQINIEWNDQDLLYLVSRRIVNNKEICEYLDIDKEEVLKDMNLQEEVFYSIFPKQVDTGKNPETFKWMLSRIEDGLGIRAPRELIHLLNEAKDKQISNISKGIDCGMNKELISRAALRNALEEVSKVRLVQTIYAEYPELRKYIELLQEHKTEYTIKTISKVFGITQKETKRVIPELVAIGFLKEKIGKLGKDDITYWVPFIYRDALKLLQGKEK